MTTQAPQTNTQVDVPRMVIVMKNGLTFWVTRETGERAQQALETQEAHRFMRIAELGETINTAEIAGVHSPETYQELRRFEAGEYKCQWGRWHGKKQVCECQKEQRQRERLEREERERRENDREATPEERERNRENWARMNELGALDKPDGIWGQMFYKGNTKGRAVRRSIVLEWLEKNPGREVDGRLAIEEDVL